MPKIPKKIEVQLHPSQADGPKFSITIDGEEFPWYTLSGQTKVGGLEHGDVPHLMVSIPTDELLVHDDRFKQDG